jgi:hypothetical protein
VPDLALIVIGCVNVFAAEVIVAVPLCFVNCNAPVPETVIAELNV